MRAKRCRRSKPGLTIEHKSLPAKSERKASALVAKPPPPQRVPLKGFRAPNGYASPAIWRWIAR